MHWIYKKRRKTAPRLCDQIAARQKCKEQKNQKRIHKLVICIYAHRFLMFCMSWCINLGPGWWVSHAKPKTVHQFSRSAWVDAICSHKTTTSREQIIFISAVDPFQTAGFAEPCIHWWKSAEPVDPSVAHWLCSTNKQLGKQFNEILCSTPNSFLRTSVQPTCTKSRLNLGAEVSVKRFFFLCYRSYLVKQNVSIALTLLSLTAAISQNLSDRLNCLFRCFSISLRFCSCLLLKIFMVLTHPFLSVPIFTSTSWRFI